MSTHSLADAKEHLPELIDRALGGEDVVITRDGHPLVQLQPVPQLKPGRRVTPESLDWIAAHRVGQKNPSEDAGTLVSRMRDEEQH